MMNPEERILDNIFKAKDQQANDMFKAGIAYAIYVILNSGGRMESDGKLNPSPRRIRECEIFERKIYESIAGKSLTEIKDLINNTNK